MTITEYDIIVVGAGHAGCEAAAAAAKLGSRVLLVTMDMDKIAHMSCNPAIGGIAKGQIVREIDALGGFTGIVTDYSTLQFRMLNRSKGPAMWSPRAQCDRRIFSARWREVLESIHNLDIWQDAVIDLIIENSTIKGVATKYGSRFMCRAVVLTSGTFGNGVMHIGNVKISGGRASEPASYGITEKLKKIGLRTGRMKTGTPPRIDGRTIDFSVLERQDGDLKPARFSFAGEEAVLDNQLPCYIAYTNMDVHNKLSEGFGESPLFNGRIQGVGPRYCPSIEDKIVTFAERERHHLFLEPEGRATNEYYINGFSSSLPLKIQIEALRMVKGLEKVRIYRPGYAIEYDYYPPEQLKPTLETKDVENLWFAGQVNGTTGYEEAAGQGIYAGINAHLKINGMNEFILGRNQAYIGVLIDDLITKGVNEPYRMFTSRAEYRLLLRQDNADERLTALSYKIGLADAGRLDTLKRKERKRETVLEYIRRESVSPGQINGFLQRQGTSTIKQKVKIYDLLLRPQINIYDLADNVKRLSDFITENKVEDEALESVEINTKYKGYLEREKIMADKIRRLEDIKIPEDIDYELLGSVSFEGRQKLKSFRPKTIGQASRISGVSPADISVLLIYLGR